MVLLVVAQKCGNGDNEIDALTYCVECTLCASERIEDNHCPVKSDDESAFEANGKGGCDPMRLVRLRQMTWTSASIHPHFRDTLRYTARSSDVMTATYTRRRNDTSGHIWGCIDVGSEVPRRPRG